MESKGLDDTLCIRRVIYIGAFCACAKGTFSLDEAHIICTYLVWSFFFFFLYKHVCLDEKYLGYSFKLHYIQNCVYRIVLSEGFCQIWTTRNSMIITKTYLYNFDSLKPNFYRVKLGFTEVYIIFLISALKHRLWILIRTVSARRF